MSELDHKTIAYNRAATMLKVQGVVSIVIGALGILLSPLLVLLMMAEPDGIGTGEYAEVGFIFAVLLSLFFMVLPGIYFIVAGSYLVKKPTPSLARGLTITNLVLGVLGNTIILIFAIISLVQGSDYEHGYKHHK